MNTTKAIAASILLGGGAYLLVRRDPVTGRSTLDSLTSLIAPSAASIQAALPAKGPGNTSGTGPAAPAAPKLPAVIGAIGAGSALVGSLLAAGGTTAAAGAAGAAAATGGAGAAVGVGAGIGTAATIGITAGIGGAVLLTWAVWKKGLFRGGEEALLVNPDRDQFLLQFGPRWQGAGKGGPAWEESGNGKLAALLSQVTGEPNGSHYWAALAKADHVDEFEQATRDIQRVLAEHGIQIQAP